MPIMRFTTDEFLTHLVTDCIFNDIKDIQRDAEFCSETLFYAIFTLKPDQITVRFNTFKLRNPLQKTLFTPNSLDFLVIYLPTRDPEQFCYLTIPIPPTHLCKSNYIMPDRIFIPVFAMICHCRVCNA